MKPYRVTTIGELGALGDVRSSTSIGDLLDLIPGVFLARRAQAIFKGSEALQETALGFLAPSPMTIPLCAALLVAGVGGYVVLSKQDLDRSRGASSTALARRKRS